MHLSCHPPNGFWQLLRNLQHGTTKDTTTSGLYEHSPHGTTFVLYGWATYFNSTVFVQPRRRGLSSCPHVAIGTTGVLLGSPTTGPNYFSFQKTFFCFRWSDQKQSEVTHIQSRRALLMGHSPTPKLRHSGWVITILHFGIVAFTCQYITIFPIDAITRSMSDDSDNRRFVRVSMKEN